MEMRGRGGRRGFVGGFIVLDGRGNRVCVCMCLLGGERGGRVDGL